MRSESFIYFYNTPESYTFLPLAENSREITSVSGYTYNDTLYPLYNEKNEQVGFVTWSGKYATYPNETNSLVREATTLIITKDTLDPKSVTGSLSYFTSFITDNTQWFGAEKKPVLSLCTTASGSFDIEKIKYITETPINAKKGKAKITIFYTD